MRGAGFNEARGPFSAGSDVTWDTAVNDGVRTMYDRVDRSIEQIAHETKRTRQTIYHSSQLRVIAEQAGRHVDPVSQHSRRHCVVFNRGLMKAGSVGFVETAVEHVGLLLVAKKAGAPKFKIDARAINRHSLKPPSGPLPTKKRLCHVPWSA